MKEGGRVASVLPLFYSSSLSIIFARSDMQERRKRGEGVIHLFFVIEFALLREQTGG